MIPSLTQNHAGFYSVGLLAAGILSLSFALFIPRLKAYDCPAIGRWCRNNIFAIPLTIIGFIWMTPHAMILLSFADKQTVYAISAAACVGAIIFLDFLCARAIAGLLILWVYSSVNDSFFLETPYAAVYAAFAYVSGLFALSIAAKPYWLRDYLYGLGHTLPSWVKVISIIYFALFGLLSAGLGVYHLLKVI